MCASRGGDAFDFPPPSTFHPKLKKPKAKVKKSGTVFDASLTGRYMCCSSQRRCVCAACLAAWSGRFRHGLRYWYASCVHLVMCINVRKNIPNQLSPSLAVDIHGFYKPAMSSTSNQPRRHSWCVVLAYAALLLNQLIGPLQPGLIFQARAPR